MFIFSFLMSLVIALSSLSLGVSNPTSPPSPDLKQSSPTEKNKKLEKDQPSQKEQVPDDRKMVCQDGSIDMGDGVCRFYTGCVHGDSLDADKCEALDF